MSKNQLIDWSSGKAYRSKKKGNDRRFTIFVYDNLHRKYPRMLQNVKLVKTFELKEPKRRQRNKHDRVVSDT